MNAEVALEFCVRQIRTTSIHILWAMHVSHSIKFQVLSVAFYDIAVDSSTKTIPVDRRGGVVSSRYPRVVVDEDRSRALDRSGQPFFQPSDALDRVGIWVVQPRQVVDRDHERDIGGYRHVIRLVVELDAVAPDASFERITLGRLPQFALPGYKRLDHIPQFGPGRAALAIRTCHGETPLPAKAAEGGQVDFTTRSQPLPEMLDVIADPRQRGQKRSGIEGDAEWHGWQGSWLALTCCAS